MTVKGECNNPGRLNFKVSGGRVDKQVNWGWFADKTRRLIYNHMLFSRTIYNEYTDIIKGSDKEAKKEREGDNYFFL